MFRSIQTKILVSHIGLVLLVSSLLGISSYVLMVDSLMKTQQNNLQSIAQDQAEKLAYLIQHKEEKFKSIAMGESIEAYSKEYHEPVLIQHFNSFMNEFPMLSYVRQDGLEEMKLVEGHERPQRLSDISKTFLYEEATWEPNRVITLFPSFGKDSGDMLVKFAFCRHNYFGDFEGLIVGGVPLTDFIKSVGGFKFDETGFMILMDAEGTILSHPSQEEILKLLRSEDPRSEAVAAEAQEMKIGFKRATLLGIDGFVAYYPVPGRNLTVMATLPYQTFMKGPNRLKNMVLAITLTVLFAVVLLSLFLARGITKPILKLSEATAFLARGDLEHKVEIVSRDEIGLLAESFNSMTSDLNEAIISRDKEILERKRAEEERKKLELQVQQSQKMEALGTLAGGVAHDLNNILGAIIGYPDLLLLDLPADSKLRKPLLAIQHSGEKAATIVQDLLTLARRGVVTIEQLNFNTIVNDYLKSLEHKNLLSCHPHVTYDIRLEPNLLDISGSSIHLSKTVMNLIYNAAEAMPKGGKITISTENKYVSTPITGYDHVKRGEYVVFTVTDEGIGISPNDLGRIFEPFYTKKVMGKSGSGLGMAVVWGTVKDHHGYIEVQSTEGKGTTFFLYFPVTRHEMTGDKVKLSLRDYMGNGESILVVDDNEEQRELAYQMLTQLGYSVTTVPGGEEAVAYFKENTADLLILDMIMDPGIDGLETYKQILQLHPAQKALIVSGYFETHRVKEAERLGVGSYVLKPYDLDKIGVAVKTELSRS
ncbi:MAG: ATP-binding protein [Desulfobulbaceae bacterium]|nr:ATP-binding protein [Desulfobulbaceae bacterium]